MCGEPKAKRDIQYGLLCKGKKGLASTRESLPQLCTQQSCISYCPTVLSVDLFTCNIIILHFWKNGTQLVWDYRCIAILADTYTDFNVGHAYGTVIHKISQDTSTEVWIISTVFSQLFQRSLGIWNKSARVFSSI